MAVLAPATIRSRTRGPGDRRLTCLLADLDALQLQARILTDTLCGEQDVRVQVRRDHGQAIVELLWCCPEQIEPAHPSAVRIIDEHRTVWSHPRAGRRPAETARFLADLLLLDDAALADRYDKLG